VCMLFCDTCFCVKRRGGRGGVERGKGSTRGEIGKEGQARGALELGRLPAGGGDLFLAVSVTSAD
jgi:hypothetical protein